MSSKMNFNFSTFRSGLLMGMADAVPGVSGGTIALILGIYNKLIFSLSDFLNFFKNRFPTVNNALRKIPAAHCIKFQCKNSM